MSLHADGVSTTTLVEHPLSPLPTSAQLAELNALTLACQHAAGKDADIYTDSAYAHGVVHTYGSIWRQRRFCRADGSPMQHREAIAELLNAMLLPKRLAIIKCPAHQQTDSPTTRGNNAADDAAKRAALEGHGVTAVMLADDRPVANYVQRHHTRERCASITMAAVL